MRRVVGLGQMLEIKPGIDLGRGDVGVAQQLLHRAQVAARLQQVTGKRVTQHVWVCGRGQAGLLTTAAQALPDRLGGQAGAPSA